MVDTEISFDESAWELSTAKDLINHNRIFRVKQHFQPQKKNETITNETLNIKEFIIRNVVLSV